MKKLQQILVWIFTLGIGIQGGTLLAQDYLTPVEGRWSEERVNAWYDQLPWLVGCNYYPATAINQIEMWQASTWDPETIRRELGWAKSIGMNTLRVYLHDLVWADDEEGLYQRMDEFLRICDGYGIRPSFVFFDDCHYPEPKLGPQPLPVAGWHNSGWRNSPARDLALRFAEGKATFREVAQLKGYVQNTIRRFANDPRVLYWELYNEPGRGNGENGDMAGAGSSRSIRDKSKRLVYYSWVWAREVNPSQPITSNTAGSVGETNIAINRLNSDFHSIHSYSPPEGLEELILEYKKDGRPVVVTEWLARTRGSTVAECLPIMKKHKVGAINWGFVSGKSGTIWPWESRRTADGKRASLNAKRAAGEVVKPGEPFPEPELWFHDLFRIDGTPFDQAEIEVFKDLTIRDESTADQFPRSAFIEVPTDRKPGPVMSPETVRAGLQSHDRALYIKGGWIRDPYIVLGPDDYYYLTGTQPREGDPREAENPYNIGLGDASIVGHQVRAWRSKDLIEWENLGAIFDLNDTWLAKVGKKTKNPYVWAPEVHWMGDRWALVHCPRVHSSLVLSAGPELKGPWTHPMQGGMGQRHDPSLFKDDDGTVYMLWQNTYVASLSEDLAEYTSDPVRIDPSGTRPSPDGEPIRRIGHEGATMMKVGGKYVHLGTAWSTDQGRKGSYNLYYCVADEITGPYGPRKFAGRFLGHGTPFQDREGKWWCTAFFNANVPPVSRDGIRERDLGENAQTINEQGVTIVPLDVRMLDNGEVYIRAKDPDYAYPGPDEAQVFTFNE